MDIIEQIKAGLYANNDIEDSVKENILELIILFHQTFPNVSLDNLNNKIKTLKIGKITIYERKGPVFYDIIENKILLSRNKLSNDDYDINHLMMRGILAVIASTDTYYGFNKNEKLYALNLGFTEMLANTLVGNDGKDDFEEEVLATNLISQIIGRDTLFDAYFNNDADTIYRKMLEAEVN